MLHSLARRSILLAAAVTSAFAAAAGAGTAPLTAAPAAPSWRAGVASVDITPDEPVWLAGYAARKSPSEGILGPIQVKALALEDASGRKLLAVTCDLLTMPREIAEPAAARISARHAIPRSRILLTASHSHSAPVIRDRLIDMYFLDEERLAQVDRYTRRVEAAIIEAASGALGSLEPARVRFGSGRAGFARNRRQVNPDDPVDHDVPVLVVDVGADGTGAIGGGGDGDGEADGGDDPHAPSRRAVLFAYACHNTTLAGPHVSGDYAGFAQVELEEAHPGLTALFASGCGGDQNPLPRRTVDLARKYGRELASAVTEVLDSALEDVAPISRTAFGWTPLPLVPAPGRDELIEQVESQNPYVRARARRFLDRLDAGGSIPEAYAYASQVWRLGDDLFLVALAGEVVVDYALRLEREVPAAAGSQGRAFVIAYANDCPAYIPSERVLREGGYEGEGAMLYYQFHGPWASGVEERVVEHVLELTRGVAGTGGGDSRLGPIAVDAPRRVWGEGSFTEGPAVGPDGALYASDIPADRILRFDSGNVLEHRRPSGRANGLAFDSEGRLIACEGANGGHRRVTRAELDGRITVLAERFEGGRLNSPNDVTIDAQGRVYFSDPRYSGDEPRELDHESVYRIERPGEARLAVGDVLRPNGLAVSPNGRTLWVSDAGARKLYAYRISDALPLERDRLVFDFGEGRGIDGMEVDAAGNVYGAAGAGELTGVWVISPAGTLLDVIPLPETATNCCFGADPRTLWMTAGRSVYRARVRIPGFRR